MYSFCDFFHSACALRFIHGVRDKARQWSGPILTSNNYFNKKERSCVNELDSSWAGGVLKGDGGVRSEGEQGLSRVREVKITKRGKE